MTHRGGPIGNRAKLTVEAQKLRSEGLIYREIARRLNISRSYASELIIDPDGSKSLVRKVRYAQPCVDCGKMTSGAEGRKETPRCRPCSARKVGTENKVWTREVLIARIQEWNVIHGEPPAIPDWNPYAARGELHDEARAKRHEDAKGYWPWFSTIVQEFGSWNAGIEAAGFESRAGHGGENKRRSRNYGTSTKRPRPKWRPLMQALVLMKNGDGSWHEIGTVEARSYQDAVEAVAEKEGTYIALPMMNVFEVAPKTRLAATPKT